MTWDEKLNILLIGGGMISEQVVLPTIFQERRKGKINRVLISSLNSGIIKRLQGLFPKEEFIGYPDPEKTDPNKNFPELYKDALSDLGDNGLVYVATPDHLHTPMVIAAIDTGYDVCCMKPLCLKVEEAWQIINKARERNAYVFTEYHKRKDRAVRAARYKYRKGELGEMLYGHAWIEEPKYMPLEKFKLWAEKSSPFEYIGTHYVDVYYYITGLKPKRVIAWGQKKFLVKHGKDAYDAIQAVIEWEDGSVFWIQSSWVCSPKNSAMTNQGLQLSGTMGEHWADHKFRNLYFLTEEGGFDHYNPNFFKAYDSWEEEGGVEYVGYGYESNSQAIDDVIFLHKKTEGLPPEKAAQKRAQIIGRWEKIGTRALPIHALTGVAVNEAVRLSVENGSQYVVFKDDMSPKLEVN